ncbi:SLAP domain-containing protein [Lactobacillus gallinarum]|uniref:S-layer protein n=1 Tax=Lactobacillus gallinarum TaxID=52242 RepID=A0A1Y4VY02_9LACO|nr:SLAP domain-containing protein [Lactobacillus gallinarum]OUQ54716.1 hypothetical protein B5E59_09375 [Lactobacillus gallinarum]OUQ74263.1 hypothetical protein B5E44_10180 [Lactobacillus gallinarum]
MKKNLRIVSVAAALLAVAPVAASAVSTVNAADQGAVQTISGLDKVTVSNGSVVNVKPNISLNTSILSVGADGKLNTDVAAAISASFNVTVDGTTATSNFTPNASQITLTDATGAVINKDNFDAKVNQGAAGKLFSVSMNEVGLNFGTKNANKKITLDFGKDNSAKTTAEFGSKSTNNGKVEVQLNQNGVVNFSEVTFNNIPAKNFANPEVVTWFNVTTGAPVTAANIQLYAGSSDAKMNVSQVINAVSPYENKGNGYEAKQNNTVLKFDTQANTDSLKSALKAAGVEVDAQGWFTAPKSFTFNLTATSPKNDAKATLPVTVNVPNGKDVTPATVPSQSKTIMHNAYFYDKDAKRVGTDKVTRYNTVTVAMNKTKFSNGIEYYEVVENGKLSGKFINADNIDGTKRTLKHNAYVYRSSKKRANKVVLKKGETVTTYGGSYTFKNGKKYYKIGNDTKKTYVKVANFD